ncbi:hypothetical protein [Actinoplanes sp. NBRC 101535]|uniref:hypothetical protein n=1 Tax=Actinoplanes sp. NBRC 101535 TaxID=3032196 RepID=UPI0024A02891|nr:hypothetical protein [Actinoplanes sp. NBRC 101535]GLY08109.1 hypothetical protein Acsp01_84880 [Actinoplanes sp. NBRC 101535]
MDVMIGVADAMPRRPGAPESPPGTRFHDGLAVREHTFRIADTVSATIGAGDLPVVTGDDSAILLGCLAGAGRHERTGLVHIGGSADFRHPGNHDFTEPGAAADSSLALATGRGELLLTDWPGTLVADRDVVRVGDDDGTPLPFPTIGVTGPATTARRVIELLPEVPALWIHVNGDVPGVLTLLRETSRVVGISRS